MPLDITIRRLLFAVGFCALAIISISQAGTDNTPAPAENQLDNDNFTTDKSNLPLEASGNEPILLAQATAASPDQPANNEVEILIIQALDQKMDLEVEDVPIQEAIQMLGDKTGIPIMISAETFDLLPYGSKTTLSATIKNQPLRECLTALLEPLGMTFEPAKDHLLVGPRRHLIRISRRATWDELATLKLLYSTPWSKELFDTLRFQFLDIPAASAEANREKLFRLANAVGEGSAAEVLEHACYQYGWVWYPADKYIAVGTKTGQVKRQLSKRISLRYTQANLRDVLLDLTGQAGVLLQMEPGVLASLPPNTAQHFSVSIENATVLQALEIIAGETGLGYFIEQDGIRFTANMLASGGSANSSTANAETTAQATVAALRANSIVGQITIPNQDGSSFSFFIRENDLPAGVNEMRKAKINDAVQAIRNALQTGRQNH